MLHVRRLGGRFAIVLGGRQKWMGKELVIGLAMALAVHLAGASVFRVVTSHKEAPPPPRPIQVEVDMRGASMAKATQPVPHEIVQLPEYRTPQLSLPSQLTPFEVPLAEPDFSSIEVIDYESLYIDFDDDRD